MSNNNPIALLPAAWRSLVACFHLSKGVVRRLWFCSGLICAVAMMVVAQQPQAQTVKSSQLIACGETNYQLRLLTVEAQIKTTTARALVIVLTPPTGTDSKVFGLYWINAPEGLPTDRNNTDGTGSSTFTYGDGLTPQNVPVVKDFFTNAKCSVTDPQVSVVQSLLDHKVDSISHSLPELASELASQGVSVDIDQVDEAEVENLVLFNGLSDNLGFAEAIQHYVSSIVSADGRQGGKKRTLAETNKALLAKNDALEKEVKRLRAVTNSFFGGAPQWLVIGFFTAALIALGVIGLVIYYYIRQDPNANGSNSELSKIREKLAEIIKTAQSRQPSIETNTGDRRNQRSKGQTDLPTTILKRFGLQHTKLNYNQAELVIEDIHAGHRLAEWREAYTDMEQQLKQLHKSLSEKNGQPGVEVPPPVSSSGTQQPPEGVQALTAKLDQMVTNLGAVKTSVDGFEGKLATYAAASNALQKISQRWYGSDCAESHFNNLVKEVSEALEFCDELKTRCGRDRSLAQAKTCLLSTLDDLKEIREVYFNTALDDIAPPNQITAKVKSKLFNEADAVHEYKAIDQLLRTHVTSNRTVSQTIEAVLEERSAAGVKLRQYHPDRSFNKLIDAVAANYEAIMQEVKRIFPHTIGTVREMVVLLATEYQTVKRAADHGRGLEAARNELQRQLDTARNELEAGGELVKEVASQLNFQTDKLKEDPQAITRALARLREEKEASVYIQLRLGLSSALIVLEKAISPNGSEEQKEVIGALFLESVLQGIKDLLKGMEEYSGIQLWNRGIYLGFSQTWLHYLIRADLLLGTYYANQMEFRLLRKGVALACSTLLAALHEFQVEVAEVGLFEELPGDMEREPVYAAIRNLPAVKEKVRLKIQDMQTGEVVVDVTSFPYFVNGNQENRGRASLVNPSAWVQQ